MKSFYQRKFWLQISIAKSDLLLAHQEAHLPAAP